MHENKAKIVSLVPSWTETLIETDLNVIARTRFCIHPTEKVKNLPAVGGTKAFNLDELLALKPDYVILDKEENKKEMAEVLVANKIELIVSHINSVKSAADFLTEISNIFNNAKLKEFSNQYQNVIDLKSRLSPDIFLKNSIFQSNAEIDIKNLDYVIWKNPYMAIGADTFISDVFKLVNLKFNLAESQNQKYPEVSEAELKKSHCLFSSEPFPFHKQVEMLNAEGFKYSIIDGEKISWYGVRNLNFLLSCQL
jgi:ABC-type Fe3+-hydroxamate transport system substrate-binding protein